MKRKELYIGCIDARRPLGDLNLDIGDTYVLRTIGAYVPRNDPEMERALNFAINTGNIGRITVAAHADCGAACACMDQNKAVPHVLESLKGLDAVRKTITTTNRNQSLRELEVKIAQESLQNLMTYECVKKAVKEGKLELRGWLVDISNGHQHDVTAAKDAPFLGDKFPPHNPKRIVFSDMDPRFSVRKLGIENGESFIV
ncbi:MAG: carbonic anhydrase, partial [Rickettsiales bacterium]|nr:carbonic anhydrase [Rickettsiales bacterium]